MASYGTATAIKSLHYTAPLTSATYFVIASLWSVFALHGLDSPVRKKLTKFVLSITVLVLVLCLGEAATITAQLASHSSSFASHHENVYTLSEFLVWLVTYMALRGSEKHSWYPYYGTWILTLVFDLVIVGLSWNTYVPEDPLRWAQVAMHLLRVVLTAVLLLMYFTLKTPWKDHDEEGSPLLQTEVVTTPKKQQQANNNYGSTVSDESVVTTSQEDEADEEEKKLQEKMNSLRERLKQKGNWFAYVKSFSVFFPMVWPSKKPLLHFNLLGIGICLLTVRVLTVLAPLQLGLLTNCLAAGLAKESFVALALYVLMEWLQSGGGIEGLREYLWTPVEQNAVTNIETASYNHILELSCDFHDEKQSGDLFTSVRQGSAVVGLLDNGLYTLAPKVMDTVVACFYFYFLFDAYLVLIGVSVVILYVWLATSMSPTQKKLRRPYNIAYRRKNQVMYDTIGGWRTVSYFNRIPHAQKTYDTVVRYAQQSWRTYKLSWNLRYAIQNTVLQMCAFAAFSYAAYGVIYGGKKVGTFVTLVSYWFTFTGHIGYFSYVQRQVMQNFIDSEELLRLFQMKPTIEDGPNEFAFRSGMVEVSRVWFSYKEGKEIIKDLTFHARPGQTIALIGETGAGKSTILKLLFRFYDVTSGHISIDGQDIRNVTLASLREHIGVVPQDPTLFNDTIMANVRYAKLEATDDEVMEACKTAAIHEKILTFREGYATKVGERGIKLSGGELQRIAIARAILKNAKIILLDEATSSVDSETEAKIQEGLLKLSKGRTTFVVAHRLSTVRKADRILVIQDGSIVEQGTPRQLNKHKGKYYSLWLKQMGLADSGPAENQDDRIQASKAQSKTQGEKGSRKSAAPATKENPQISKGDQTSLKSQAGASNKGQQPPTQTQARSGQKAAQTNIPAQPPETETSLAIPHNNDDTLRQPSSDAASSAAIANIAAKIEQPTMKLEQEEKESQKSNGMHSVQEHQDSLVKADNGERLESQNSSQIQEGLDVHERAAKGSEQSPASKRKAFEDDVKSSLLTNQRSFCNWEERENQYEKLPLSKAVQSILGQPPGAARHGGDLPYLSSIEEKEEEEIIAKTAANRSALGRSAEADPNEKHRELSSNRAPSAGQKPKQKPDYAEPIESLNAKGTKLTQQPVKDTESKEPGVAGGKSENRSASDRIAFQPRPDAPEFVPKDQRRGSKSSQTTQGGSSSQDTSHEFEGAMQETGNIRHNQSARRSQSKSDPSGQSLKKIQDQWIAGLGENIAMPENVDLVEVERPTGIGGHSGHVASRSTPHGNTRRRNRGKWKNATRSSMESENSASAPVTTTPSSVDPTPPMLKAPNPTPTGYLSPAGESPHYQASGGVQSKPNTK